MSGLPCAFQQALRILSVCGGVSAFFHRRRSPGDSHVNSKCWYDLMPGIDLKCGDRKPDHLYVGTLIVPSCLATSCAVLHTADFSTVSLMSLRQVMLVRRYNLLKSPKHQSGLNLVCSTTRNLKRKWNISGM